MMKYKNKIACLITLYLVFAIWFLNCQFQSSKQSPFISKQMLLPSLRQQKLQDQIVQSEGNDHKVIFLLIDSAKYSYWQQFSVIKQLVQKHPKHSILAKTIVSQPTMTTQKIQTLMTGSQIFSFTSIIDAFFSSSVTIDNIIHQLNSHNKKTVSLGDDTWSKLFNFKISYPCVTTFDIWDWQTCDLIIYKNLIQQIQKGNQFIVAHFLALDHIGHSSSSTSHPSFKDKKQQMSQFIRKVVARMDNNTVLMVTGDHGMRDDGNHGGATPQETESFVFAYIKSDNLVLLEGTNQKQIRNILQPDITTTLSLILGIPIPFNSIGIPLFIPQNLADKQNNYSQHISENLKKHFINLMSYHNLVCPSFNNTLSENIELSKLKNIQQDCLSHLSHNQPNIVIISISIFLMGIAGLCVAYMVGTSIKQYIMVLILMVPHPFSWLFIRNSSSYFLTCLLIMLTFIKMSIKNKAMILGCIFMLAQFEPVKNGEYEINWMANEWLSFVVARYQLHVTVTILWCYYQIRKTIVYSHNLRITNASVEPQAILYVLELSTIMLVTLSHICRKIQILQLQKILNIVILFLFVISIIISILSHAQPNKQLKQQRMIRLLQYCLILFLGPNALVIYLFIMFKFYLLDQLKEPTYKQKQFNGYFCYLLGHFIWWTIGSRYQYSSIDIKQSYIFSNTYHSIINPICLLIFMMAPYLISYITMLNPINHKPTHFVSLNQSEQRHSSDNSREPIQISEIRESKEQRNKLKVKYILMPLCWLVCCCITVVYNNEKILYTVVYVPMLVIEVGKISMMMIVAMLGMDSKLCLYNKRVIPK